MKRAHPSPRLVRNVEAPKPRLRPTGDNIPA